MSPEATRPTLSKPSMEALLERIEQSGALPPGIAPREAVSAVMCTLFQRITRGEFKDVLHDVRHAELQRLLARCPVHESERPELFDREEFLTRIAAHLMVNANDVAHLARVVFREVQRFMSPKEISDVRSQLPGDLQSLWTAKAHEAA